MKSNYTEISKEEAKELYCKENCKKEKGEINYDYSRNEDTI